MPLTYQYDFIPAIYSQDKDFEQMTPDEMGLALETAFVEAHENLIAQVPETSLWEVVSHNVTITGKHIIVSFLLREQT